MFFIAMYKIIVFTNCEFFISSLRVIEGIFRSLNNLLEQFHQSFFFYLLPESRRYVSIGLYMPPFGCLLVGPLIMAVVLWSQACAGPAAMRNSEPQQEEAAANEEGDHGQNEEVASNRQDALISNGTPALEDKVRRHLSQISHCSIKGLSVREVTRTENMITKVKFF